MFESIKYHLREKVQREERRHSGGFPETGIFHSRSYHREFEGYTEIRMLESNGKTVLKRIYTGKYYEPDLAYYRRITLRFFYVLFYAAGLALFLFTASRPNACNTASYVGIFQLLFVPAVLWISYVLIFYVPQPGKLTVGEYHTLHGPLIRASMVCACLLWICASAALVCLIMNRNSAGCGDFLCIGGFLLSGGFYYLIHWFESRLQYTVTGKTTEIEDGVEIVCD